MSKWNGKRFSIYTSDEENVLNMVEELGKQTNHNTDTLDSKTDLYGDHKGTWQGLNRPTLSEEGIRATVEDITDNKIPSIETSLDIINNKIPSIETSLDNKADKNGVRKDTTQYPINVSEFDTETKMLFTGGSVAVVGENAVGVENVKDEAITHKKRTVLGQHGILLCNATPNFDLNKKTLTIPKGSRIRYDKYVINLNNSSDTVLDISIATGLSVIYYDIKENEFIIDRNYHDSSIFTENSLYIGQVDLNSKTASLNTSVYSINGYIPVKNNLNLDNIGCNVSMASIICPTGFVNFDFENNKIIIPSQTSGSNTVQYKNNYRNIPSTSETIIDISSSANQCFVVFNIDTLAFKVVTASTIKNDLSDRECVLALFDKRGQNATMIGIYKINGKFVSNEIETQEYMDKEEEKRLSNVNWQDITFVGETMLGFRASDDSTAIESGVGAIYMLDLNSSNTYYKMLKHDFGHCNSVDYKEETDTIIFGNGSGEYNTNGEIIIIQGVKHWINLDNNTMLSLSGIDNSDIVRIDVGRTFGDKVNVIWGESNIGENNICYVISNDIQNIRRVLLGKGTNQLENGNYIEGKSDTQFNGTYKILNEYTTDKIDVLQGGQYYNGYLYLAMGHSGNMVGKYKLNPITNKVEVEIKQEIGYNSDGSIKKQASEGLCVKNGLIHHTTFGTMTRLYKYRPF